MKWTGVSKNGARIPVGGGLSVHLPYGGAYGKDEDGDLVLIQFSPIPRTYREGSFTADDDAPFSWRIGGWTKSDHLSLEDLDLTTFEERKHVLDFLLRQIAELTVPAGESGEPYELDSSTETEETDDGFIIRMNLSSKNTGGSYQQIPFPDETYSAVLVNQKIQIMMAAITVRFLIFGAFNESAVSFCRCSLSIPDDKEEGFGYCEKILSPILRTLEIDNAFRSENHIDTTDSDEEPDSPPPVIGISKKPAPPKRTAAAAKAEAPKEKSPAARKQKRPLFDADKRIDAMIALDLFAKGVAPIRISEIEWEDGKARQVSGNIHPNRAGKYENDLFDEDGMCLFPPHNLFSFLERNEKLRVPASRLAKELREHFQGHDLTGFLWLYLANCNMFSIHEDGDAYTVLAGSDMERLVPGCRSLLEELIRSLRAFNRRSGGFTLRYIGAKPAKEKLYPRPERVMPPVPSKTPKIVDVVKLFATQAIDYYETAMSWDGKRCDVFDVTLALENGFPQELTQPLMEAFAALEENEDLKIPSSELSPGLRTFLSGQMSSGLSLRMGTDKEDLTPIQDMTGAMLLHMFLWGKMILTEPSPDHFVLYIARDLAEAMPDCMGYGKKLLAALRDIEKNATPFETECRIFSDWCSPYSLPLSATQEEEAAAKAVACADMDNVSRVKLLGYDATPAEKMGIVPFDHVSSVTISGSTFVLTGTFEHENDDREKIAKRITAKGGRVTTAVSGKTNYLVIGALGGFGERKIEQAEEQRAKGKTIRIIREDDLFRAL